MVSISLIVLKKSFEIKAGWQFKIEDATDCPQELKEKLRQWNQATVPGTVHTDLLNLEMIPDPFYSDNEQHLGWIAEKNWLYRTKFDLPPDFDPHLPVFLAFEGLDTIAEIQVNGTMRGKTENMFCRFEIDITEFLKEKDNELLVRFISPVSYARDYLKNEGEMFSARHPERVYIRKAQYAFGWDWGPAYPTMGIWRPVHLLQKEQVNIAHIRFDTIAVGDKNAKVQIGVELAGDSNAIASLRVTLSGTKQKFEKMLREMIDGGMPWIKGEVG